MDLITADPAKPPSSSSSSPAAQPTALGKPVVPGEKKSKKATLIQMQNDTISAAKAALNPVRANIMPQKQKKKVYACCVAHLKFPSLVLYLLALHYPH